MAVSPIVSSPCAISFPPHQSSVIRVALKTLAELTLSLMLGSVCSPFAAMPKLLWSGIAAQCVVNTVVRSFFAKIGKAEEGWLSAFVISAGSLFNLHFLIHEMAHAAMIKCLLQHPNIRIELVPYFGACTSFRVSKPTSFGKWIGTDAIQPMIAAAGPVFSLIIATFLLLKGLELKTKRPFLAKVLILTSWLSFLVHAKDAFMAAKEGPHLCANDFNDLKKIGLNPLYAGTLILAVPTVITASRQILSRPKSAPSTLALCCI